MFLLAILIPACASSIPAFLMMYSAYKLNKQGDNIHPWRTPFPIWSQSVVPCPVLTFASWPAYRVLRRLRPDKVVWYSHLLKNFHSCFLIHTVKGFGVVNTAEVDVFFWNSLAFLMTQQVLETWSLLPLPFLNPAWTSGRSHFMYCWAYLGEFWALLC